MDDQFDDFVTDVLAEPSAHRHDAAQPARRRSVPVITAPVYMAPGVRMVETLAAIRSTRSVAIGFAGDVRAKLRDLTGGRVRPVEEVADKLQADLLSDLGRKAAAANADAVVGATVQLGELHGSVLYGTATGTPVRLEQRSQ